MANQRKLLLILLVAVISGSTARVIDNEITTTTEGAEEDSLDVEKFFSELQPKCLNKTGSNDTYEMLVLEIALTPLCLVVKLDMENFGNDLENLTDATRVEFFTKYCPQVREALTCLDSGLEHVRKCLDPEEIEVLDIVVNIVPEALNFVCKDQGQIFFSNDTNFDECVDKVVENSDKCFDKVSNATEVMDLSAYGQKQCDELAELRVCFEEQLVECKSPRLIDLIDMFYRPVVKASPCKQFIKFDDLPAIDSNAI